jgi:hypothetical protein
MSIYIIIPGQFESIFVWNEVGAHIFIMWLEAELYFITNLKLII